MEPLFAKNTDKSIATTTADGRNDFDGVVGRWRVAHRRLRRRLVNDTHWEEFAGSCEFRPLIGGLANVDDNIIELPSGTYRAATFRVFDPATRLWSIWWIDGRVAKLDPPVHGRFEHGIGTFFGDDVLDGRPIRVRFLWSLTSISAPRWEQAFSADGGASWEVNWIMQFERVD